MCIERDRRRETKREKKASGREKWITRVQAPRGAYYLYAYGRTVTSRTVYCIHIDYDSEKVDYFHD